VFYIWTHRGPQVQGQCTGSIIASTMPFTNPVVASEANSLRQYLLEFDIRASQPYISNMLSPQVDLKALLRSASLSHFLTSSCFLPAITTPPPHSGLATDRVLIDTIPCPLDWSQVYFSRCQNWLPHRYRANPYDTDLHLCNAELPSSSYDTYQIQVEHSRTDFG
jgi:hypothetical protein